MSVSKPPPDDLERSEIQALGATRAELGRDYEPALLDAFADRVEAVVDQRIAAAVEAARPRPVDRGPSAQQLALAIISLVAAIPISIVLGIQGELVALFVAWAGIVAINYAYALQGRRP